jgi:Cft2 family RNA processing exonuclease
MISFKNLGSNFIGASCYHINFDGNGIILDAGIDPRKTGIESLPDFRLLKELPTDYVIISHAHQDHIGSLPFLIKAYPHLKIISTPQTRALAELVLHNAVSILRKEITDENFSFYNHDEVDLLIKSMNYLEYEKQQTLSSYYAGLNSDVELTFYDAGHILGAAGILLENQGKKIFYTGDIKLSKQQILPGAILPSAKIDILILETTYGSTPVEEIPEWNSEAKRFANEANNILSKGGSILIPVFALGKMQEILSMIFNLIKKRKLAEVSLFVGGIGKQISRVYDLNRYTTNRLDREFEISSIHTLDYNDVTNLQEFFKTPSIVLASSGMMIKGTSSYDFAIRWLSQKNSAIFTVGYMDPDSPGHLISKASKGDELLFDENRKYKVESEIKNFRFPSHSNREELLQIVEKLSPKEVILVHGEEESINWIARAILNQNKNIKVYVASRGKEITLHKS